MSKIILFILIFGAKNTFKISAPTSQKNHQQQTEHFQKSELILIDIIDLLIENLKYIEQSKEKENSRILGITNTKQYESAMNEIETIRRQKTQEIERLNNNIEELLNQRNPNKISTARLERQITKIENAADKSIKLINSRYKNHTSTYKDIEKYIQNMITIVDISIKKIKEYIDNDNNTNTRAMILRRNTLIRRKEIIDIIQKIENVQNQILDYQRYDYGKIINLINHII